MRSARATSSTVERSSSPAGATTQARSSRSACAAKSTGEPVFMARRYSARRTHGQAAVRAFPARGARALAVRVFREEGAGDATCPHRAVAAAVLALAAGRVREQGRVRRRRRRRRGGELAAARPADHGAGRPRRRLGLGRARRWARRSRGAKIIDKGVEVYNVPGAGGTIGLSQLASKHAGKSNELMVMGLVMLGAIKTNDSPVDLSQTTPIASLTTEAEAIAVRPSRPTRSWTTSSTR